MFLPTAFRITPGPEPNGPGPACVGCGMVESAVGKSSKPSVPACTLEGKKKTQPRINL